MDLPKECFSGDQGVFWDAVLKIAAAENHGIKVHHFIHSADTFSRSPAPPKKPAIEKKSYNLDGNLSCWMSTLNSAEFLGLCPISPKKLTQHVNLSRISQFENMKLDKTAQKWSDSDWYGVVLPRNDRCAHYVTLGEVREGYNTLKRSMKRSLSRALKDNPKGFKKEAEKRFEEVWSLFTEDPDSSAPLTDAYKKYMSRETSSAVEDSVSLLENADQLMISLWIEEYEKMASLYNEAVKEKGFPAFAVNTKKEEVPYFVLQEGVRLTATRKEIASSDNVVIPKAVVFFSELRTRGPVVLPENGSFYFSASLKMEELLQEEMRSHLHFHPIVQVHFNALDKLKDVEGEFTVPHYLQYFLGKKSSFRFLGNYWRDIVKEAEHNISRLVSQKPLEWISNKAPLLVSHHKEAQEVLRKRGATSKTEEQVLRRDQKCREEIAYTEWAKEVVTMLRVVESLEYWNSRPMHWWTRVIPGWEDAVLEGVKFSVK